MLWDMIDGSADITKEAQRVLHNVSHYWNLRTGNHLNHREARPRFYVPVGNLTRKQALSDRTWNRMVELGLVDPEP